MEGGSSDRMVSLVENEDYYMEHGLMVLTARYHLRRGYCCEQGCRHCPYREAGKEYSNVEVEDNETTN